MENHFLIAFVLIAFRLTNESPMYPNMMLAGILTKYGKDAHRPVFDMLNECTLN